ncbi:MAG: DNA gyrase inhibitor YacG [Betaproteobacteria bacterium]
MAKKSVACPRCGRPVEWTAESRFRPFCSERCKTRDLGAWAADEYRIGRELTEDDMELPQSDEPLSS